MRTINMIPRKAWTGCRLLCLAMAATVGLGANDFDPYQLNGGLSAAVAGKDYVVLATDTRLMGPGGYDILERNHMASRLWAATTPAFSSVDASFVSQTKSSSSKATAFSPLFSDGSLSTLLQQDDDDEDNADSNPLGSNSLHLRSTTLLAAPPVLVASSGCATDCEMLKRQVRAELRTARAFGEMSSGVAQVAHLLGQVLYSRRGFPYYSFCLVAGCQGETGRGQVYAYDAIGSFEQVAVATSGTGREMLQPILDGQFQSVHPKNTDDEPMPPLALGVLPKPLLQVDCSAEVSVSILTEAYRAVAEREIGVGDQVAFCVLQRLPNGRCQCQVWTTPLKKH